MKKLTLLSLLMASIAGAHGDFIKAGAICAGAATLSNGSIVNIGQPFVGVMSAAGGESINVGLIPQLGVEPPIPPSISGSAFVGGLFQLTISPSEAGRSYFLQASTNLTEWVPLISKLGTGLSLTLEDNSDVTTFEYRFYRVGIE
ncbi:MAG: hypothetical protein ABI651_03585 [Verrucomicrobiota bacterium]